eukprot:8450181-Alexandrium_andersonii.AAC.2
MVGRGGRGVHDNHRGRGNRGDGRPHVPCSVRSHSRTGHGGCAQKRAASVLSEPHWCGGRDPRDVPTT